MSDTESKRDWFKKSAEWKALCQKHGNFVLANAGGNLIEELLDHALALEARCAALEWQTIDTAPTDGTIVEGYGQSRNKNLNGDQPDVRLMKSWGDGKGWSALNDHSWFTVAFFPTHWRPHNLPKLTDNGGHGDAQR